MGQWVGGGGLEGGFGEVRFKFWNILGCSHGMQEVMSSWCVICVYCMFLRSQKEAIVIGLFEVAAPANIAELIHKKTKIPSISAAQRPHILPPLDSQRATGDLVPAELYLDLM